MSDPNAFGLEDGAASGPARLNPAQYKFSQDELRVLKECNTESFYQRSLPLGTGFGLAAFFGVQGGHLKPNPRFGAFPKVTLAVIVGYFLGKLSYQQACAEKLMALPGSYIGQLLREKKEGRSGFPPPRSPAMFGASPEDIYSDAGPGSSLDLDMDRPLFGDDHYRAGQESAGWLQEWGRRRRRAGARGPRCRTTSCGAGTAASTPRPGRTHTKSNPATSRRSLEPSRTLRGHRRRISTGIRWNRHMQ
ncbi:OCIA domain-containing protein 1-like isoform X1 [Maniola jurtina]|uniref:OCIA domain-containing protein 1-like isoform X1 n=1 Tax=Maniola jurtina TaxID=191418 RepID=UPI001E68B96E|nr:OCIA domain-containing protein 1-like isoform X1 [Maniola jurtina]